MNDSLVSRKYRLHLSNVSVDDDRKLDQVAELHMELLGFGPMAGLGKQFVREVCYRNHMRRDLLWVTLAEIDGELAGFVAVTPYSGTFHRTALGNHLVSTAWYTLLAIIKSPLRVGALLRALRVLGSRRKEKEAIGSTVGEVVCVAVRPKFLRPEVSRSIGNRLSECLILDGQQGLVRLGAKSMRMLVDADNRAALMLYHLMGAKFSEYRLGGEPMMQVTFDLESNSDTQRLRVPPEWRTAENVEARPSGWQAYWNTVSAKPRVFAVEAQEYVDRLYKSVDIQDTDVLLDFGCGFGYVAALLAERVDKVDIWDNAENVRAQALAKTAGFSNISYPSFAEGDDPALRYDKILVHSVIQYMATDELVAWLNRWRPMLKPGGQLIISDVLPVPGNPRAEVVNLMKFSAANGFFFDSLINGIREVVRYSGTRGKTDLGVIPQQTLADMAEKAAYHVRFLAGNLSYRSKRYTAVLTLDETSSG